MTVKTMSDLVAQGENAEILYWVGSAGSFDDRAKKITRSFVKIMNHAKVNFGVLGTEESASGDVAKRAGNEFLFQMQALMNIEILNSYNITRIVTTCPHDYNTLKNEYKDLGGVYEVLHHTEFISELIQDKRLILSDNLKGMKITYHDPCYLGRGNGIFNTPRELLKAMGVELVEMKRFKRTSFCCGAGGAQMFKEPEKGTQDININRTQEAMNTKAKTIATACAFCNTMITDGVKFLAEGSVDVLDIAELIVKSQNL
ncbi:MAG: CoB--CoM heterodisulfide reductase [Flavobacteriales bacterium]|nr:CoB--CoM heterodisulfide reductase [Flavobacteriales bacterium]